MAIDTKEKLLRFFSANDIELYNNEQVDAWLSCLVAQLKNAKLWHWRPLRSEDIIKCMWGINIWDDICTNGGYSFLDENCRPYSGLVSLEVMEIVIKIIVELGENVKFFVSDYYPFLDYIEGHNRHRKIDTTGMDHFIMVRPSSDYDNWDEEFRLIFGMWNGG